ncbi:hypothetical protein BDY19DRAFT_967691 [Irpex rosettiformis]|uniref:Uncharacterized protein n=1 Tax=Irpex rosettiformis TaxID=378272 RepID=A0ACB8TSJ4_9APHY|nr:hypothetical protein BDY19DRAFT_967691 [Irpex rosettiformis]
MMMFRSLTKLDCTRLARTCTAFYNEAMDIIWADVESFYPFVMCMSLPALEIQIEKVVLVGGTIEITTGFSQEPHPSGRQLFCKHVHRVKRFQDAAKLTTSHLEITYQLTPDALETISRFICQHDKGHGCLFPRLETLTVWGIAGLRKLPKHLPYISRHTLQSVKIDHEDGISTMESSSNMCVDWPEMIPLLHSAWPRLTSLELADWYFTTAGTEKQAVKSENQAMVSWLSIQTYIMEQRNMPQDVYHGFLGRYTDEMVFERI